MLWEARARADARCDVNLMTSCCSDGRSKRLNEGIVVFLLRFVQKGAPPPVLLLSSGHQTGEPLWVQWRTIWLPKEKEEKNQGLLFPLGVPVQFLPESEWFWSLGCCWKGPSGFSVQRHFTLMSASWKEIPILKQAKHHCFWFGHIHIVNDKNIIATLSAVTWYCGKEVRQGKKQQDDKTF